MSLQVVYGRSGTGKTTYILKQISRSINNGKKKYIITPEQFSFTAEKELLNSIKGVATVNAEVLTFNRMAHRVAQEVGEAAKTILSDSGKSMLIYNILLKEKEELKFLGKSDNNIDIVLRQLAELKKHGVLLENMEEIIKNVEEDTYLATKLKDIYLIYSKYQEKIENNYIDEDDALSILARKLDFTDMFCNCEIYIDEFMGFTKQEYLIIEKLMKVADLVTLTCSTDKIEVSEDPNTDIFYSNKLTVNNILKIAKEHKIEILPSICLEEEKRFKVKELKHLEKNIFKIPYNKYQKECSNIELFLASNQYSEIEHVAERITELVRDENYKYSEISIITKNIDTYSNMCRVIFSKYNIPMYLDEKSKLNQNILIKFIMSILNIFAKNWSNEAVLEYIKSGFCNITENELYELERYAIKWHIRGNKWYKEDWNFHDLDEKELENINLIRRKIIEPLINFKNKLSKIKSTLQISKCIYEFLIENEIDKKLEEKIKQLILLGELNLASTYETSWKITMRVLDEIVLVLGNENISFENYMYTLQAGFNNTSLGSIPMAKDQVIIGDIDRSRNHKVKVCFIIGLNDGIFSSVNSLEGFLNDTDREKIKTYGIELAKGTLEQIYDDNFNIYKAFTTPEEKLILSYSSSDIEGKALRPSTLITKIKNMYPLIKEESNIIDEKFRITVENATFERLLEELRKFRDGKEIEEKWFNVYNIFNADDKWHDKLKNSLKALNYTNNPEKITKENIEKMYGKTLKTSVSKLEQYRRCPFSYYLKYGLKLNDKDESKVETVDTGTFLHDVIDSFFEELDIERKNVKEITDEEIENIVERIIIDKTKLDKNYIYNTSARYINLANRLKRVVITSIKYIVQTIKQSSFEVLGHEVEFGEGKKYKPIKILTDSGKTVEITGKIDRIDIAKNADGTYVRIIDYKSSIKNIDLNQVIAGLQLQLLTYLNETCKVEDFLPAGVLYFNMTDPNIKSNSNLSDEEITNQIKQEFKMKGLILADVNVIKMMDNNIEKTGSSNIIPAGIKKDGEISDSKTKGMNLKQFKNLQSYMNKIIKQISEEILNGNIDLKPFYNTKSQKGKTPCEYCKYKTICRFDVNNKGNNYNYIKSLNKEEILDIIKEG